MADWQPIETAPKDGTRIDIWAYFPEHDKAKRVANVTWDVEEGQWRNGDWHFGQYKYPPTVTHWMPLPAPPAVKEET